MTGDGVRLVYCPFGSREEALSVSTELVERRLVACANVLAETQSIYRWQGAVETASETPVLFKTDQSHVDRLMVAIAALHSYDEPAIISLTVDQCPAPFKAWLVAQLDDAED